MIIITARRKDFTRIPWCGRHHGLLLFGWFGITVCYVHEWTSTAKEWVGSIRNIEKAVNYKKRQDLIFSLSTGRVFETDNDSYSVKLITPNKNDKIFVGVKNHMTESTSVAWISREEALELRDWLDYTLGEENAST